MSVYVVPTTLEQRVPDTDYKLYHFCTKGDCKKTDKCHLSNSRSTTLQTKQRLLTNTDP